MKLAEATLPASRIAQDKSPEPWGNACKHLDGDRLSRILARQICSCLYWCPQMHKVICSLGITASSSVLWVSTLIQYIDEAETTSPKILLLL